MKQLETALLGRMYPIYAEADRCPLPPWEEETAEHPYVNRTVKEVSAKLFGRIASGSYPFGTRLPAERELSQEFGQTRNTIRQAIGFLENYGVVTRRGNAGTFVSARASKSAVREAMDPTGFVNAKTIAETISPFDMYVAQSGIEPEIARLATVSMSVRDLANLKAVLLEIDGAAGDADRFVHLEQLFLMTLCMGTRNSALIGMYTVLNEVRSLPAWRESRKRTATPDNVREINRLFQFLIHALEHRHVDRAVEYMRLYIATTQGGFIQGAV